jgi:hypothetical protein
VSTAGWREAVADALDEQAAAITAALAELDNVHEILQERGRDKLSTELRGFAAGLRSEATDLTSEARALRAGPAKRDGFPLALTTRHPRRAIAAAVADPEPEETP